ncbi:MAG TPA: nicotinate phosphoribosyltransferase, partial [Methylothermaceae bacterium]|nr:nicotinate phosphoribosyltransferase [Methylothermaceae bacterium]
MNESVLLTDLYQLTMLQGYWHEGMAETAIFELFVRKFPPQRNFLIAAGLEQALDYLENLHFTDDEIAYLRKSGFFQDAFLRDLRHFRFTGDVDAMPEGTVFFPNEPILRVTAPLPQAQLVETRLINLLQFQTL